MTQKEKADRFQALHQSKDVLLFPNPWDGGSARLLENLGYRALATSSAACAATLGRRDGKITRDEALAHCRQILQATNLPVAADLENGFAVEPTTVAETIRLAAAAGLVGGSIEDSTGDKDKLQYDLSLATDRIAAAVSAARALPFHFTLTARAEKRRVKSARSQTPGWPRLHGRRGQGRQRPRGAVEPRAIAKAIRP